MAHDEDDPTPESSDSRTRILCAATRLFGEQGFSATSVREVVDAAGVTKPTLYYYFENKEALYREALQCQLDGLRLVVDSVLAAEGSVRDRLGSFLEVYVRGGIDNPASVRLVMMASAPVDTLEPRLVLTEAFHQELRRLTEVFDQGKLAGEIGPIDSLTAVTLLVGAANLTLMDGLTGAEIPEDFASNILNVLYAGVRT